MTFEKISAELKSYDVARLIPTVPDSRKEEKAVSILLAAFKIVPAFALELLHSVGAPASKRATIQCYTEIVSKRGDSPLRPDGLIVIEAGRKTWSAIVEAKVGTNGLQDAQVESYVSTARQLNCDAVITISNQYATLPTHHPLAISKAKLGKVGLYHFSWLAIVSTAKLLSRSSQVDDPEQAFILEELIRFYEHKRSGVSLMTQMGPGWKSVCEQVHQGVQLSKTADDVSQAVATWQQLTRYLALKMSQAIHKGVAIHLPRSHAHDPAARMKNDTEQLTTDQKLSDLFEIPNAAGRLKVTADFRRRSLVLSMRTSAPKDKKRAKASVNWFTRQLKEGPDGLLIRALWPGRTPATMQPLGAVLEDPLCLVPDNCAAMPTAFEVVRIVDLAAGFKGKQIFVAAADKEIPKFYSDAAQKLRRWLPRPPKIQPEERSVAEAPARLSDGVAPKRVTGESTTVASAAYEESPDSLLGKVADLDEANLGKNGERD